MSFIISKNSIANVLQHQFAVVNSQSDHTYLGTKGIRWCTGLYGWDKTNEVSFMCHFDHPWCERAVKRLLKTLKEAVQWWWSPWTRKCIERVVCSQTEVNITLSQEPIVTKLLGSLDVSICTRTGEVSKAPLSGKHDPAGFGLYIFREMEHVLK